MTGLSNLLSGTGSNKLLDRFFRRAENVVWDMMSGRIGYKNRDGEIISLDGNETDGFVPSINPFGEMSVELPAFAQSTPLESVKVSDMILQGDKVGWVIEVKGKSLRLMRPNGDMNSFTPPKTQILDFGSGVMVVRSLVNMLPGSTGGLGGLQAMLMPMLLLGDGDMDMEKMLPMMLMMQGAAPVAADGTPNPMASMFGGGAAGGMGGNMMQMMQMQMMMKALGMGSSKGSSRDDGYGGRPSTPFNVGRR